MIIIDVYIWNSINFCSQQHHEDQMCVRERTNDWLTERKGHCGQKMEELKQTQC